jgi:hypothetical protein
LVQCWKCSTRPPKISPGYFIYVRIKATSLHANERCNFRWMHSRVIGCNERCGPLSNGQWASNWIGFSVNVVMVIFLHVIGRANSH